MLGCATWGPRFDEDGFEVFTGADEAVLQYFMPNQPGHGEGHRCPWGWEGGRWWVGFGVLIEQVQEFPGASLERVALGCMVGVWVLTVVTGQECFEHGLWVFPV